MEPLDVIANDPDWMPISQEAIIREAIPHPHISAKQDLYIVVRELANGLLYASVEQGNGKATLRNAHYNTQQVSTLPKGFHLTQLSLRRMHVVPGFYATFEFKAGKAPSGQDAARIEYTTWHNPDFGERGLTRLLSLNAEHAIQGGHLDIGISSPAYWLSSRLMVATLHSSDSAETLTFDGNLEYDREGRLTKTSLGLPEAVERRGHPFGNVYLQTSNGAKIDALSTAVTLVGRFPSQRPLDLLASIQYQGENGMAQKSHQSRMFR